MGNREAILKAVRATRILCQVAADRAHTLGRWVRCVEVAIACHSLRDMGIDHAWLHDNALVGNIDLKDLIKALEADHNTAFNWQCSTAEPRARTACNKRQTVLMADLHNPLHLFCGFWQQD